MTLTVGQKLWYVPVQDAHHAQEVTVAKVGSKWAKLNPPWMPRIDLTTLAADSGGYSSHGRCYLSREDYERACAIETAWRAFTGSLPHLPPKGLTLERLTEIAAELRR